VGVIVGPVEEVRHAIVPGNDAEETTHLLSLAVLRCAPVRHRGSGGGGTPTIHQSGGGSKSEILTRCTGPAILDSPCQGPTVLSRERLKTRFAFGMETN
jgi:hypothetical protein